MARGIQNFPNIVTPDSDYPNGRIKDNPGDATGTPINEYTNGDLQQFFAKIMREAGITPNGLPDNEYSGNQYYQALIKVIETTAVTHSINSALTVHSSLNMTSPTGSANLLKKNNMVTAAVTISGEVTATSNSNVVLTFPTGFEMKPTEVPNDFGIVGFLTVYRDDVLYSTQRILNGINSIDACIDNNGRLLVNISGDATPTAGEEIVWILSFQGEAAD